MKSRANLFLFDNFQIGHEVKEQQGEHDSAFFKDTDKWTHRVHEYNDTMFDATMVVVAGKDKMLKVKYLDWQSFGQSKSKRSPKVPEKFNITY